jgi:hypothetical protein
MGKLDLEVFRKFLNEINMSENCKTFKEIDSNENLKRRLSLSSFTKEDIQYSKSHLLELMNIVLEGSVKNLFESEFSGYKNHDVDQEIKSKICRIIFNYESPNIEILKFNIDFIIYNKLKEL